MRILVVNPNTSEEMTSDIGDAARRYARADTEIETICPDWGAALYRGPLRGLRGCRSELPKVIRERAEDFDGVVIACFGDPGLPAAREISPVPSSASSAVRRI